MAGLCRILMRATLFFPMKASLCRQGIVQPPRSCVFVIKPGKDIFSGERYLGLVEQKFGPQQRRNVEAMARIRLRRKLLGDAAVAN